MLTKEEVEKALAGAPVETKDGREVTQLTKFRLCDGEEILAGIIYGQTYVSEWNMNGSPRLCARTGIRLKKEKRMVEYTLMVLSSGETAWVESSKVDSWNKFIWRKTNQTMTKEIEVE